MKLDPVLLCYRWWSVQLSFVCDQRQEHGADLVRIYFYTNMTNLQFLNNVNINKTKVLLPQAKVTLDDFCYPV
jgi:hypothetical protein